MVRIVEKAFLDMGDLAAPKGTPSWCLAVREEARSALTSAKTTREQVTVWVNALKEGDHFQTLTDAEGNRFLSWEGFCQAPPPYGFGCSAEEVELIISRKPVHELAADPNVTALAEHGEIGHGRSRGDIVTSTARGNEATYLVRRLKRDAPEIAEALARGEYPSARAAGIAAGIVRPDPPLVLLKRAWNKASKDEKDSFMTWAGEAGW